MSALISFKREMQGLAKVYSAPAANPNMQQWEWQLPPTSLACALQLTLKQP